MSIRVDPRVDMVQLQSWDNGQTPTSYTTIELPLRADNPSYCLIHYCTNTPVTLFRDRNSTAGNYTWYARYEGCIAIQPINSTSNSVNKLYAGRSETKTSFTILQGTTTTTDVLDNHLQLRKAVTSSGASIDVSFQTRTGNTYTYMLTSKLGGSGASGIVEAGQIGTSTPTESLVTIGRNNQVFFELTIFASSAGGNGEMFMKVNGSFRYVSSGSTHRLEVCYTKDVEPNFPYVN